MNIPRQRFKNTQRASQPGVTAVEIRDPTVADEDLGVLTRDLLQLEAKPLRARQVVVRSGEAIAEGKIGHGPAFNFPVDD
jgi:hypothetical protein